MTGPFMSLLSLLVFLTYVCPITSYQITHIKKLQKATCEAVYERASGSRKELDFTKAIGDLLCSPGPNGFIRYHCMAIEDGHDIQFCAEWIWIESGQCPRLYSLQGIINPRGCDGEGCPTERYQSHMYYKYPACFVKEQSKKGTVTHNTQSPKIESSDSTVVVIVVQSLIIAAGVAAGIISLVWRRRKNGEKRIVIGRSKALTEAVGRLNNGKCIILTGKKGEGISTFMKTIHKKHFRKYKWKEQDYGFHQINDTKHFFLVIGERNLNDGKEWDALKNLIKNNERQTKIVIDVPCSLYDNYKERLHAECGDVVVGMDLSSDEWKMDEVERKELVGKWMREKKIDDTHLSESKKRQIVDYESEHYGFCYICGILFDGTREQVFAKLRNVEYALKEIGEGNLSSRQTNSDMNIELERKPLIHSSRN